MKRTWIVAHDFSAEADFAARVAVRDLLDGNAPATLILVHAYHVVPVAAGFDGATTTTAWYPAVERTTAAESAQRLQHVAQTLRDEITRLRANTDAPTIDVEIMVSNESPAEGIIAAADARSAHRIVVGTHGRTGLSHLLLGSVAERVVRTAHVPVLVAKA